MDDAASSIPASELQSCEEMQNHTSIDQHIGVPLVDQSSEQAPTVLVDDALLEDLQTPLHTSVEKNTWGVTGGSAASSITPEHTNSWSIADDMSGHEAAWEIPAVPSFVKPIPDHLNKEDVEYLQRKGALSIPEPPLRDALLKSFLEYVHPCLPILQLQSFLDSLQNPSSNEKISLPLFQAIMFAGAAWVDIKPLRRLGYLTRKAARKALYLKARLLYDFDYEEDRLSIVQTLLLLTLWWEGPNEQKDGWYWSGLAVSVARTIGLNRELNTGRQSDSIRPLRRRLWWCCVMRDAIASFGLNRPPRLKEADFQVAPLSLEDFEIIDFCANQSTWLHIRDKKSLEQLATVCIDMVSVCRNLRQVLEVAFVETPSGHISVMYDVHEGQTSGTTTPYSTPSVDNSRLESVEGHITSWRPSLPAKSLRANPMADDGEEILYLHQAMVSMLHHTAILLLIRSMNQPGEQNRRSGISSVGSADRHSRAAVRAAAVEVTSIAMELYKADLMKLLPATGISCLITASISHVLDLRSYDTTLRREGRQHLEENKQALRELLDAHIAAEWAVNFITFIASEVKPHGDSRRLPSGMISGEIQWADKKGRLAAERVQRSLRQTEQSLERKKDTVPPGAQHQDTGGALQTATPAERASIQDSLSMTQWLHQSPDAYPDLFNFPESWLDVTDPQGLMSTFEWTGDYSLDMNAI